MKLLALLVFTVFAANAAEVCPPAGGEKTGDVTGVLKWRSYAGKSAKRHCFGNEVSNTQAGPLEVSWPETGVAQATVKDRLEVSICCFEDTITFQDKLAYGLPARSVPVTIYKEPPEGDARREEGFPDLIDHDARERTINIRGTLWAGGQAVRIDLLLRYSASKFGSDQFAYQFALSDRSADPVDIDWAGLRRIQSQMQAATQPIANGAAHLFLSAREPGEVEDSLTVRTKSGDVAGRFRFDGFLPKAAR